MNRPELDVVANIADDSVLHSRRMRRTASDDIFDYLYSAIVTLKIEPGSKMSETEIAKQFDVSRQPVREAFIRLDNMGLLEIRPQRATLVRKINEKKYIHERFVRTALEMEAARQAVIHMTIDDEQKFEINLKQQKKAIEIEDFQRFLALDGVFHRLIFAAGKCDFAFNSVGEHRSHVDRICVLALSNKEEFMPLYEGHKEIYQLLLQRELDPLLTKIRQHLLWFDNILKSVKASHGQYFAD